MKLFTTIFSILFFMASAMANTFYISGGGDNANDGLSPGTPWQNLNKLNTSFGSIAAGDVILFHCGETFSGELIAGRSGTTALPIIFGSYGTGAQPVISGLITLSGWTNVGGNIWQCDASMLKNDVNVLTIDGTPQAVGRTPNDSFFVYQSATRTQLTSAALAGTSWVGAEIVMKKNSYTGEKAKITYQSGNTVNYKRTKAIDNGLQSDSSIGTAGYGFFLQRFAGSLDRQGEWFLDTVTHKMKIYSVTNPASFVIKASSIDTVINLSNKLNIVVRDLAIEGAGMYGVYSYGGTNITIKNCSLNNNTKAVYGWNTQNMIVDSCAINNSFNGAILISNNQSKQITITNNSITNTGQLFGMGLFYSDANLKAIVARDTITNYTAATSGSFIKITDNVVRNTGHAGIQFQGSNVTVKRNVIDTFCNRLDDNGGIYTFLNNQSLSPFHYANRTIEDNFILNSPGAPAGAGNSVDVSGYYMDDQSNNIVGRNNTIANIPGNGVQMNNPTNQTFTGNTIYNCAYAIAVSKKPFSSVSNNSITNNIIYQRDSTQFIFFHVNNNLSLPVSMTILESLNTLWSMDSNYISNLKYQGYGYYYSANGSSYVFPPAISLAQWQGTNLHDLHSVLPPVTYTGTNSAIYLNETNNPTLVNFTGLRKIDPKGTVYNGSAVIASWSSLVLIDNGTVDVSNTPPVCDAGSTVTITLPDSATLDGSASYDPDGSVAIYDWLGPLGVTITNAAAATATAKFTSPGVYNISLTVTDNLGATASTTKTVIVLPAVALGCNNCIFLRHTHISITP